MPPSLSSSVLISRVNLLRPLRLGPVPSVVSRLCAPSRSFRVLRLCLAYSLALGVADRRSRLSPLVLRIPLRAAYSFRYAFRSYCVWSLLPVCLAVLALVRMPSFSLWLSCALLRVDCARRSILVSRSSPSFIATASFVLVYFFLSLRPSCLVHFVVSLLASAKNVTFVWCRNW